MPERIQRKRNKGWRMPPNTLYVGRPTIWGNPFYVRNFGSVAWYVFFENKIVFTCYKEIEAFQEAVRLYEKWFDGSVVEVGTELHGFRNKYGWKGFQLAQVAGRLLHGKDYLACWCSLEKPCHVDVLLRIANQESFKPE